MANNNITSLWKLNDPKDRNIHHSENSTYLLKIPYIAITELNTQFSFGYH